MEARTVSEPSSPSSLSNALAVTACRLCGSTSLLPSTTFQGKTLVKCGSCSFIFMNPQPSNDELAAIYNEHYFLGDGSSESEAQVAALKRATARMYLDVLGKRRATGPSGERRLLEIGCGQGELLLEAALQGYNVTGVEYSKDACDKIERLLKSNNVEQPSRLVCGELLDANLPAETFDACVLSDVIEHVRDPLATLRELHRVMKPGGTIVIATPSLSSWSAFLMGRHWMEYKPEHLLYFDPKSMRSALEKSGFSKVDVSAGWKILNAEYIAHHFVRFPVSVLTPIFKAMLSIVPSSLLKRDFKIVASGMVATASRE